MKVPGKPCAERQVDHVGETAPICPTETTVSQRQPSAGEEEKERRKSRAGVAVLETGEEELHALCLALAAMGPTLQTCLA